MPVVDILIAVAVVISVIVGFVRGFVKESMSLASLLLAVWAAFNLGPHVARLSEDWLSSAAMQLWFGRILVFVVVLAIGGLLGWGITKLVRLSVLSGMDRGLGMAFGFCRGVLLVGVFVIGGQIASLDQDDWWRDSRFIPYATHVADWLRVMAPKGVELLQPPEQPVEIPAELTRLFGEED
ncbi:MAG: CvpA family protein [Woeseiaceae bacterium]|nr:CvpA family protein [Woeseiaceae bacterium]